MIHQILPELDLLGEPMKRQLQVASAAILLVLLELIWLAKPKPAVSPGEAVSFPLYPIKAEAMEEGEPSGLETENPVRILIPSVSIDVAVKPASVIGNRWDFFEDAVSFWKESATPGEGGNIILYAHRATHFGTLNEAQIGEPVVIETNEGTFRYTISEIKVVSPSQVEVFTPTINEQLTLLTCTNQDDSDRLIIIAEPSTSSFSYLLNSKPGLVFSSNYGQFSFSIFGVGTYIGSNQQSIHQLRSGAILIHFKGDVQFLSQTNTANPDTSKRVKLYALVGRREGYSSAILKDHSGPRPHYYLMLSHVPRSTAKKVVTKVASSVEGGDWETLYDLTSSTFTSNTTKEEFITSLSAQEAEVGRVVNVEILSEPDIQLSPMGTWFFTVQTRVSFDVNGILETDEFIDTYVLEDGEWKFWFSVAN